MKNRFVKIISLMLALALSLSALSACSSSTTAEKKKKKKNESNTAVSSEYSSTDDGLSDYIEDGDFEDGDFEDDEFDDGYEDDYDGLPEDDVEEPKEDENTGDDLLQATVPIFNSTPIQNSFLGFNSVYHGYAWMPDMYGRNLTEEMAQLETDRAIELGLRIARTAYYISYPWDSKTNSYNWETDQMKAYYTWGNKLKTGNVDVWVCMASGGYLLKSHGLSIDKIEGEDAQIFAGFRVPDNDQAKIIEKYGEYIAEMVAQFRAHGVTNLKYIANATEPADWYQEDKWGPERRQEWLTARANDQAMAANAVNRALIKRGLRDTVKQIGANNTSGIEDNYGVEYTGYYKKLVDKGAVDYYSMHNYCGSDITADNYGLWEERLQHFSTATDMSTFIYDEYGFANNGQNGITFRSKNGFFGYQMALANMAFLNYGVKSAFMWTLFDQLWPNNESSKIADCWDNGVHMFGCMPFLRRSSYVYPFYHYVNLVNNIMGQSGAQVFAGEDDCADGVYAAMTKGPDGSYNIMVINTNIEDVSINLQFEKSLGDVTLYRHVYDPNNVFSTDDTSLTAPDKKLVHAKNVLKDQIIACGVVFYTTRQVCK